MITMKMIDLVKCHEGLQLTAYADTRGLATIGWGHKILPDQDFSAGVTIVEAGALLMADLQDAEEVCERLVACYDDLGEVRQAVVLDMVYNLGPAGFGEFKELIAALNSQNYLAAANAMRASLWYGQVKDRAVEDCQLMESGVWPS